MDDLFDNPDFDDVAELAARGVLAEARTNFPAKIIEYDRTTFTASIKPVLRNRRWDPVEREVVHILPKIIHGCRVAQHYTDAGGLILPYKPGDYVWAECSERSMAEWRQEGGDDVTPASDRRFDHLDAVVTGPIRAKNDPPPSTAHDANSPVLNGNPVLLGDATATNWVPLDNLVEAEIDALWDALDSHTHPETGATTGPPAGVATATTSLKAAGGVGLSSSGNVASTKVKAK